MDRYINRKRERERERGPAWQVGFERRVESEYRDTPSRVQKSIPRWGMTRGNGEDDASSLSVFFFFLFLFARKRRAPILPTRLPRGFQAALPTSAVWWIFDLFGVRSLLTFRRRWNLPIHRGNSSPCLLYANQRRCSMLSLLTRSFRSFAGKRWNLMEDEQHREFPSFVSIANEAIFFLFFYRSFPRVVFLINEW